MLAIGASFLGLLLSSNAPAPDGDPVGVLINAPTVGLRFRTPENWVLSSKSKSEELLLFASPKKATPLLRVRRFDGRLSPKDRISSMRRGLPEAETLLEIVTSEQWDQGGRLFETAHAVYKAGTQEWHARFTLVDQPRKTQHGFWLYGKKKDVEKHWAAVQTSIASAKSIAGSIGGSTPGRSAAPDKQKTRGPAVWKDEKLGLELDSWPAGFGVDKATEKAITKGGLKVKPLVEKSGEQALFQLEVLIEQSQDSANEAAGDLEASIASKATTSSLRRVPLRIGGETAHMLRWIEAPDGERSLLHETYFVQRGALVLRIDYEADETWAQARSRRTLVRDFLTGIHFI
ncbi:MAG: hypothetical protein ACI9F9_000212 [Candidatus Paceibacteria bacterium]|jgi:hypothetical protein